MIESELEKLHKKNHVTDAATLELVNNLYQTPLSDDDKKYTHRYVIAS